jgi:hypothetical protein
MTRKIKNLIFILFALATTACSPAQRIERITRRNPQLLERKTIIARDTLIYPGLNFAKPLIIRNRDTVRDAIGQTKFEYIRDTDTLYITVKTTPDTITVEIPIEAEVVRIYETKKEVPFWCKLPIGVLVIYGLFWIFKRFERKMDRS